MYQQDKSQALNGDGDIYSTIVNTYNALDQVTLVRQYQGADTSGVYQDTTAAFDGYGRLKTKHVPEQNAATNTTWDYNNDDSIQKVTDARGASATYSYNNNRHLVTGITYSAPSGVAATPNVTFSYDAAGNRTSASSSVGTSTYQYNQLSRLTSESYQFSDLTGTYTLNYTYNLANELTSLSIPFTSQTTGYNYDSAARLSSVSASGFQASYNSGWPNYQTYTQSLTSFISSIAYRAWGAPKSVTYGNTVSESTSYNARMQPTTYTLNNVAYTNYNVYPSQSFTSMSWNFDYYADGRVNHAYDSTWNFWDRSFSYDHVGRLAEADSNRVARGQSWDYWHPDPYKQTMSYDVWDNLKRTGYFYNNTQNDFAAYTNNRRSDSGYDANGGVTTNGSYQNTNDVAGENVHAMSQRYVGDGSPQWPQQPELEITQSYNANGQPSKRTQITRQDDRDLETGEFLGVSEETLTSHYIHSSVLGARVVEIDQYGQYNIWIFAAGQRIATATVGTYANTTFEHHNPLTGSWVTSNGHSANRAASRQERDPMNGQLPLTNPGGATYAAQNPNQPLFIEGGDPSDFSGGYQIDGMPATPADVARGLGSGSITPCPNNNCGVHSTTVTARSKDGTVIGSSTFLLKPGAVGWDGSLNGTYRVGATFGSDFDFNNPSDARAFLETPELPYMRISGGFGGPQNSLWLKSAKIFGQSADVDDRSAVFNLSPDNPHIKELCGEDNERKPFDVTLNLGLPDNAAELTPTQFETGPTRTPIKGRKVIVETGMVGGSRVRTATDPPSDSNYFVGRGSVRFDNVSFTFGTAQAIFAVSRTGFSKGGSRDSLVVTIMGKDDKGKIFKRDFQVSIHCPE